MAGLQSARNYTALKCSLYDVTYEQIESDLRIHRQLGTTLNSTKYAASAMGSVGLRGITAGFFGGVAYLLTPTDFRALSHHAKLHVAYMRMLLHVEDCFGPALPDVAFVLTTSDTPRYVSPLELNTSSPRSPGGLGRGGKPFEPGPYPICGIGKSDYYPDTLLVPNFHFHMRLYDNTTLALIPEYTAETPWERKKNIAFGRFSRYRTNREAADVFTYKAGRGGRRMCYNGNKTCPLREHFVKQIAGKHKQRVDVSFRGKISMLGHTKYKFLVNLDGQGISSRLEQLLPLGSVVLLQQSGYYAYYYRTLLKHRVNVLEFWRDVPEEILAEMDWAEANDDAARRIAAEGQRVAATYLTGNARTCYWYRLLHGLRSALAYTPHLSQWRKAQPLRKVIEELLPHTPGGKELYNLPWAP